jgi:hypothetical protein
VEYPEDVNLMLERAYNQPGTPMEVIFTGYRGMSYAADLSRMVQTNRQTGVERDIGRYVNGNASSWVARRDPTSGRNYYLDTANPQLTTWSANVRCPSAPPGRPDARPSLQTANPLSGRAHQLQNMDV